MWTKPSPAIRGSSAAISPFRSSASANGVAAHCLKADLALVLLPIPMRRMTKARQTIGASLTVRFGLILSFLVLLMSDSPVRGTPSPLREQLLKDQTYAVETVKALAVAIEPNEPWAEQLFPESGCFKTGGSIKGCKTSFNLDLRAKDVGRDLEDAKAIDAARVWLTERNFDFVRYDQQRDGLRQLWAVKEDEHDGIGISVSAHPGVIGITGTTKCRQ